MSPAKGASLWDISALRKRRRIWSWEDTNTIITLVITFKELLWFMEILTQGTLTASTHHLTRLIIMARAIKIIPLADWVHTCKANLTALIKEIIYREPSSVTSMPQVKLLKRIPIVLLAEASKIKWNYLRLAEVLEGITRSALISNLKVCYLQLEQVLLAQESTATVFLQRILSHFNIYSSNKLVLDLVINHSTLWKLLRWKVFRDLYLSQPRVFPESV